MSSPENERADLRILNPIPVPMAGSFSGTAGPNVETVWNARVCKSAVGIIPNNEDAVAELRKILPDEWPLAYLERIDTKEDARGRGYGSQGLSDFIDQAKSRGCRLALAKIEFHDQKHLDRNIRFYITKNHWIPLFRSASLAEFLESKESPYTYVLIPET